MNFCEHRDWQERVRERRLREDGLAFQVADQVVSHWPHGWETRDDGLEATLEDLRKEIVVQIRRGASARLILDHVNSVHERIQDQVRSRCLKRSRAAELFEPVVGAVTIACWLPEERQHEALEQIVTFIDDLRREVTLLIQAQTSEVLRGYWDHVIPWYMETRFAGSEIPRSIKRIRQSICRTYR